MKRFRSRGLEFERQSSRSLVLAGMDSPDRYSVVVQSVSERRNPSERTMHHFFPPSPKGAVLEEAPAVALSTVTEITSNAMTAKKKFARRHDMDRSVTLATEEETREETSNKVDGPLERRDTAGPPYRKKAQAVRDGRHVGAVPLRQTSLADTLDSDDTVSIVSNQSKGFSRLDGSMKDLRAGSCTVQRNDGLPEAGCSFLLPVNTVMDAILQTCNGETEQGNEVQPHPQQVLSNVDPKVLPPYWRHRRSFVVSDTPDIVQNRSNCVVSDVSTRQDNEEGAINETHELEGEKKIASEEEEAHDEEPQLERDSPEPESLGAIQKELDGLLKDEDEVGKPLPGDTEVAQCDAPADPSPKPDPHAEYYLNNGGMSVSSESMSYQDFRDVLSTEASLVLANDGDEEIPNSHTREEEERIISTYEETRAIATKVIGRLLVEGYTLTESQCDRCEMPLMEKDEQLDCVVCPHVHEKAKKRAHRIRSTSTSTPTITHATPKMVGTSKRKALDEADRRMEVMDYIVIDDIEHADAADVATFLGEETDSDLIRGVDVSHGVRTPPFLVDKESTVGFELGNQTGTIDASASAQTSSPYRGGAFDGHVTSVEGLPLNYSFSAAGVDIESNTQAHINASNTVQTHLQTNDDSETAHLLSSRMSTNDRDNGERVETDLDGSQAIYQRLVDGWLLTTATCPVCKSRLMQSPQGKRTCVFCETKLHSKIGQAAIPDTAGSLPPDLHLNKSSTSLLVRSSIARKSEDFSRIDQNFNEAVKEGGVNGSHEAASEARTWGQDNNPPRGQWSDGDNSCHAAPALNEDVLQRFERQFSLETGLDPVFSDATSHTLTKWHKDSRPSQTDFVAKRGNEVGLDCSNGDRNTSVEAFAQNEYDWMVLDRQRDMSMSSHGKATNVFSGERKWTEKALASLMKSHQRYGVSASQTTPSRFHEKTRAPGRCRSCGGSLRKDEIIEDELCADSRCTLYMIPTEAVCLFEKENRTEASSHAHEPVEDWTKGCLDRNFEKEVNSFSTRARNAVSAHSRDHQYSYGLFVTSRGQESQDGADSPLGGATGKENLLSMGRPPSLDTSNADSEMEALFDKLQSAAKTLKSLEDSVKDTEGSVASSVWYSRLP